MNTEDFIKKVIERRGDELFDYSKVVYTKTEEPVIITCKLHGDFTTTPHQFMAGKNCPVCLKTILSQKFRSTTEIFIEKAKKVHGDKYNYSEVEYKTNHDKIKIYCNTHNSTFQQTPNSHLAGKECPKCGKAKRHKNKTYTQEEYIKLVTEKHGNKYDYSQVKYTGCFDRIKIHCQIHGFFLQKASEHLFGKGCRQCGNIPKQDYKDKYAKQFIEKVKVVHNNFFDYSKTVYTGAHIKIIITCPFHGDLVMKANTHLNGTGCKHCSKEKSGFGRSNFVHSCKKDDGIFYLIECFNEEERFYKIGITGRSIEIRYARSRDIPYQFTLIKEVKGSPEDIWNLEKLNLKNLKNYKYEPKLKFNGHTECLSLSALPKIKFELNFGD